MAIAYDSNGTALGSSALGSFTFAFTVGSGANRILFVGVGHASGPGEQISAITYGGVSLTKVAYGLGSALWYLIAPATGANNLVFTSAAATTVYVSASSYSGAKQSGQPDASVVDTTHTASAGGDAAFTTAVTTVADQDWIIAASVGPIFQTGVSSDCTILASQNGNTDVLYHKGPVTPAGSNSITIDTGFSGGTPGPTVLAAFSPVPTGGLFGMSSLNGLSTSGPKQFTRIQ